MTASMPANPIENRDAITRLTDSISALIGEFVKPLALQSVRNGELIERNAEAVATLHEDVTTLRTVVDDLAAESAADSKAIAENSARFDVLLAEARADRQEWREALALERQKSDDRFNAQMKQIEALGEQNRALISVLAAMNTKVANLEQQKAS